MDTQILKKTVLVIGLLLISSLITYTQAMVISSSKQEENKLKKDLSGTVTNESGKPIVGVTVAVKGTSNGTTTDENGEYSLNVNKGQTIVFSFIGYKTRKVKYQGQSHLNLQLEAALTKLNQIVTVGYAKIKEKDRTGAIVTINANDLNKTNNFSVNNMLQGKVPGAHFQQVTAQPGGETWVNIRGAISPTGSNYPLYVIDGVPLTSNSSLIPSLQGLGYGGGINRDPLVTLNPNDIKSITVLEGPSATAIYGSNAANGVVLITTKQGKSGKVKVKYNGYYTVQTPKDFLDLLDAKQFMKLNNKWGHERWLKNNNITPYGNIDSATIAPYVPEFFPQQIKNAGMGTDWLGVVMNDRAPTTSHNLSISGGSENTQVYSSFNYTKQEGILKHSDLKRFSGRLNITQKVGSRITLRSNLMLSRIKSINASTGSSQGGGEMWPMLLTAIYFPPTIPIYDSTGAFRKGYLPNMYNPAAFLIMTDKTTTNRVQFAPRVEVDIFDDLKATVSGGVDLQGTNRKYFLPVASKSFLNPKGQAQISNAKANNLSLEGYLNYSKDFGKNHLKLVLGAGYYNTNGSNHSMVGYDFFTDAFGVDNIGIATNKAKNTISSGRWKNIKLSQFGRLDFAILDRYLITATVRRDGASFFAENKKWGIFPGFAVAWRINKETFLNDVWWLSNLKLRLGYGESGNASIIGNNSLSLYQTVTGLPYVIGGKTYNGIIQTQIGNPDLTWETDASINIGLDFGFFNGRITGSINAYRRTAKDLLAFEPLPINNPVTSIAANIGSTRSDGFDIAIHSKNIEMPNFSWSTDVTLTHYNVYWEKRNPKVSLPKYVETHDPLHAIYGWVTDGIIQSKEDIPPYMPSANLGNVKYVDINQDGKLDINDVKYLGNSDPNFSFGFGNTFSYKAFDLNIYFYGSVGVPKWDGYQPYVNPRNLSGSQNTNTDGHVKEAWSSFNTDGTRPGIASDHYSGNNPTGVTDFGLSNISFVRLKNVTLGYTLPPDLVKKSNFIENARVYVNLGNMWLLTNFEGIDPEMASNYDPYPVTRSATVGVNLTF